MARELDAADDRARHWAWPARGALPVGGDAHRDAACRMFQETFNPYRPRSSHGRRWNPTRWPG